MRILIHSLAVLFVCVFAGSRPTQAQVSVALPLNGTSVANPVRVAASATSSRPITYMRIYVDNVVVWGGAASQIDTSLTLPEGSRHMVVQAWDSGGQVLKAALDITVTQPQVLVTAPGNGATVSSPVRVTASSTGAVAMAAYVDNNLAYKVSGGILDASIAMGAGQHSLVVQAWDRNGGVQKTSLTINVVQSGIKVDSPSDGATVDSPVRIASSASGAAAMAVYVDSVLSYKVAGAAIDASIPMASGQRYVVVQAWINGTVAKTPLTLNVRNSIPADAKTYDEIDEMSGWEHCDQCSGPGGDGVQTVYWMAQFQSNPSLDGQAIDFFLGGSTPYASALWWKQLGAWDSATNFVYDLSFYYVDGGAPQALEFDVNQSAYGRKFIFGTECNVKETGTWRVWNADPNVAKRGKWQDTGIACSIAPYKWHTLRWEFRRLPNNDVLYVAVTLDGIRTEVNRAYNSEPSSAHELNVAFQMDGNEYMYDYHVWLDKVRLTAW